MYVCMSWLFSQVPGCMVRLQGSLIVCQFVYPFTSQLRLSSDKSFIHIILYCMLPSMYMHVYIYMYM